MGLRAYPNSSGGRGSVRSGDSFGEAALHLVPDGCCWRQPDADEKEAGVLAGALMAPAEGASCRPIRGESAKAFEHPQRFIVPDANLYAEAQMRAAVCAVRPVS